MSASAEEQQPLIDKKESAELKAGKIDRVQDEGMNTVADLTKFTKEQKDQAKEILKAQEKLYLKLEPEGKKEVEETVERVDSIIENALADLNISTVRVACAMLSDIVGFRLEIDENFVDQFGLTERHGGQETKRTGGFAGYREEQLKSRELSVEGRLDAEHRRLYMKKFDVKPEDVEQTLAVLNKNGTAEYKELGPSGGPVLVLMPEMHYDAGILRNNFDSLTELAPLISVLATEGAGGEINQGQLGVPAESEEFYRSQISKYKTSVSSLAVEGVLGDRVYTLGAEDMRVLSYAMQKIQLSMTQMAADPVRMRQMVKHLGELIASPKTTKRDIFEFQENAAVGTEDSMRKFIDNIAVAYRNQIWLHRLQNSFLEEKDSHSSASNITFMVCGAKHVKDLTEQAAHFGFKGVVVFNPKSFDDKFDPRTLQAYASGQFGEGDGPDEEIEKHIPDRTSGMSEDERRSRLEETPRENDVIPELQLKLQNVSEDTP